MNWFERLKIERKDLNEKIEKLSDFLDTRFVENAERLEKISDANKILLREQLDVMRKYRDILVCRIELNERI